MSLYLITESLQAVEYLNGHGVYPDSYMVVPESIGEVTPYLSQDDKVLVLTQGLTDWTMLRLKTLLKDLEDCAVPSESIIKISTIELEGLGSDYILVQGDLFNGKFVNIEKNGKWGKEYSSDLKVKLNDFSKPKYPNCLDIAFKNQKYKPDIDKQYFEHLIAVDVSKIGVED